MKQRFENLEILTHPLIQHKLTLMRDKYTSPQLFHHLMKEISFLMAYEVTKNIPLYGQNIETPLASMRSLKIKGDQVWIVPILRAGLTIGESLKELLPTAKIGHIGLYRDAIQKKPVEYLIKLPAIIGDIYCILVDPMLATGYSSEYALDILNKQGLEDKKIALLTLLCAPEGVSQILNTHPSVKIFSAALDDKLDDHAYIIPGLGDAGDRLFGTL